MELPSTLKPPFVVGEYELRIDEKNRLTIPEALRKKFDAERDGQGFIVTIGINGVPWFHASKYYEEWASNMPSEFTPTNDQLEYDQANFALAFPIEWWDGQGRVLIPDKILKRARIDKLVTLIGVRDHLELHNRNAWEFRREHLEQQRPAIAERARKNKQAPVTS